MTDKQKNPIELFIRFESNDFFEKYVDDADFEAICSRRLKLILDEIKNSNQKIDIIKKWEASSQAILQKKAEIDALFKEMKPEKEKEIQYQIEKTRLADIKDKKAYALTPLEEMITAFTSKDFLRNAVNNEDDFERAEKKCLDQIDFYFSIIRDYSREKKTCYDFAAYNASTNRMRFYCKLPPTAQGKPNRPSTPLPQDTSTNQSSQNQNDIPSSPQTLKR